MRSLLALALVLMAGASSVTAVEYVAEVYFVVDPQVVRNYQDLGYDEATALSTISLDIDYFIYQINKMFASLIDSGLDLQVRAKHVEFVGPMDPVFPDCFLIRGRDLQVDMAIEQFKVWLDATGAHSSIGYDMAVVWTGYDLFSTAGDNQVAGYASVGATCNAYHGVSVVEFDGTMATTLTTAHEIGHILGAPHVTGDPASSCSSYHGFIMSPESSPTNEERWSFSSCTTDAILQHISTLTVNCLLDTSTPASSFQMTDVTNADILDAEKICQRKKGHQASYFGHYLSQNFYYEAKGDEVCQKLMCGEKKSVTCTSAIPSDGMMCDHNKRCDRGLCVASSIPTGDIDTTCVFGDIESEAISGTYSCSEYVAHGLDLCYPEWVHKERCCATCKARKLDIEGCEYGDRNPVCKNYTPAQLCPANSYVCCELCHGYVGKRSIGLASVTIPDVSTENPPPPAVDDDKKKEKKGPTTSD